MTLGIRAKLFLISLGLIVASVVVGYIYSSRQLERQMTEDIESDLRIRARLVADRAREANESLEELHGWQSMAEELGRRSDARVTLVRKDGKVLGDSDVPADKLAGVENHRERPEVIAALSRKPGHAVRVSVTVGQRMLYVAEPIERDGQVVGVARVSMPLARVDEAVGSLSRLAGIAALLAIAAAVVLSTLAAQLASRTARALTGTARRMASGDLRDPRRKSRARRIRGAR